MTKRLVVAVAAMMVMASAGAQEQAAPSIRFSARGATISATPHGNVAVFGVGVTPRGFYPVTFKWSGVVDCDANGQATIDFGFDVPQSTIWAVVDGKNGQDALVTPGGVPVPEARIRPDALHRRGARVSEFAFDHPVLDLLYVEPAGGAWTGATADGGKNDRDGPNGVTVISVDDLHSLPGTTGLPSEFKAGGRLIAIDFVRMQAVSLRLDAAMIGAAR